MANIDLISFQFSAQDTPFVHGLYARWDEFCHSIIENIIDEVISAFDEESVIWSLDKLELNIGNIPEESFFEVFPVRLRGELERAMMRAFVNQKQILPPSVLQGKGVQILEGEKQKRPEQRNCEISDIISYLLSGDQNFLLHYPDFHLQTELEHIYVLDRAKIAQLVQCCLGEPAGLVRLFLFLDNDFFSQIVDSWVDDPIVDRSKKEAILYSLLERYPYLFLQLLEKNGSDTPRLMNLMNLLDWRRIDYSHIPQALRQQDVLQNITKLPLDHSFELSDCICAIGKVGLSELFLKPVMADTIDWVSLSPWFAQLFSILGLLSDDCKDFKDQQSRERALFIMWRMMVFEDHTYSMRNLCENMGERETILPKQQNDMVSPVLHRLWHSTLGLEDKSSFFPEYLVTHSSELSDLLRSPSRALTKDRVPSKQAVFEEILQERTTVYSEHQPECIMVRNAGLVLLAPWFVKLFSMLGLLNEDCKDFKDFDSRKRAIFIMQRMVTSECRSYTASELTLNRILVNYPSYEVLPGQMELTDNEVEMVQSMLAGAKANWVSMENTSLEGFQHSFIERQGVLNFQEEKITLTVVSCAYDLLLDSLPWAYQLIRFPWLEQIINVRWREK